MCRKAIVWTDSLAELPLLQTLSFMKVEAQLGKLRLISFDGHFKHFTKFCQMEHSDTESQSLAGSHVSFAHSSWCVTTCLGFKFPWCCLASSTPGFICGSGARARGRTKHMRFGFETKASRSFPAWDPKSLHDGTKRWNFIASVRYRNFMRNRNKGWKKQEKAMQKNHDKNQSLNQLYLEAYDSWFPKMIKHAGKAFRQWAKNPRITQIQQISTPRNHWDPSRTATLSAPCFALGVLQESCQDETWLDMWTEYTNCLASFQNWFDSCLAIWGCCRIPCSGWYGTVCVTILWYLHHCNLQVVPRYWRTKWVSKRQQNTRCRRSFACWQQAPMTTARSSSFACTGRRTRRQQRKNSTGRQRRSAATPP